MKKAMLISLGVLSIIIFVFYWFQIRPSRARSYCNWSVRWGPDKPSYLSAEKYDYLYKMCLRSKGVER